MRIAIDASPAAKAPRTGTELYTLRLILALSELDARNEYTLLLRNRVPQEFATMSASFRLRQIPQRWLWAQTRLPRELRALSPEVFFTPANVLPFLHPPNSVVTIHDVAFHYYPECYSPFARWYLDLTTRFALKHACKVISVSHATRDDLLRIYRADPSRIEVIHSGIPTAGEEPPSSQEIAATLRRFGIAQPYLLYLGRLEAKKNVARIVAAFLELKGQGISQQLVLAGSPGVGFSEIKRLIEASPFKRDIILTGYVGEKRALYAGADVFVFPSLYEGFGFPILEAAALGAPVVTSRVSSLPEVAGQAALLVDPLSVGEIAAAISKLIRDQKLRAELVRAGYERLQDFDWSRVAAQALVVLEEVGRNAST